MGDTLGLRLLFVEDHADTAQVMSRLMNYAGHTVTVATSISEARDACQGLRFDVLICDIQLPDGDGRELLEHVRDACPNITGIVLSGHGQADQIEQSKRAGFAEHLIKPISTDALLAAIQRAYLARLRLGTHDGQRTSHGA